MFRAALRAVRRRCGVTRMIHTFSLGRAARYYPEWTAFASGGRRSTFRELHERVAGIAAALNRHGFGVGDRLAILLPNESDYIELVDACAWLGVIVVPLNTRLSVIEIEKAAYISTPRRFFTSWTFRSCSRRLLSAPARSRFRSSARKASARRSNANASVGRYWRRR